MIENDVHELVRILGSDADKTFAEAAGDSIRRILGKLCEDDSSIVCGLIIDFGLKGAMEMLESALNLAEAANEA